MSILRPEDEILKWVVISLAVHILAAGTLTHLARTSRTDRDFYAPVYKVNIVTLEKPKKAAKKKTKPAKKTKKIKPVQKKKTALKKVKKATPLPAVVDPSKRIEELRKKHEVEMRKEEIRESLLAEVEDTPSKTQKNTESTTTETNGQVRKVTPGNMDAAMQGYYDLLGERIRDAWTAPGSGNFEGLVTIISITIAPSGQLINVETEEGSGNGFFDQSALRAVRKAAPFPPMPEGYEGGMEVGLRFKP